MDNPMMSCWSRSCMGRDADQGQGPARPARAGLGGGGGAVDQLGAMASTLCIFPPRSSRITIGLSALRLASIVILPLAPGKSFVAASASRMALGSVELARLMASASTRAASYPQMPMASGTLGEPSGFLYFLP